MAEETERQEHDAAATGASVNPAAISLALGAAAQNEYVAAKAEAFLEKQSALSDEQTEFVRLQKEHLHEQRLLLLSHLKWRRFDDQMKGALQIMLVALGAAVVIALGAAVWNASRADGIVVEAFTAPAGFAARGIGGDVVAADLTGHIAAIRNYAVSHSIATSGEVSRNAQDDVKVEIPETGISFGEAWRYLQAWLGHEQHISGSLRLLPNGDLLLRTELDGGTVIEASGPASDIEKLEQTVSERLFARVEPINAVIYLWTSGRNAEAQRLAEENALTIRSPELRADAYSLWAETTLTTVGDLSLAIARVKIALALDPRIAISHYDLARNEFFAGHEEAELSEVRATVAQREADQPDFLKGAGFAEIRSDAQERIAALLGDYAGAEEAACPSSCLPANIDEGALYAALRHDSRTARARIAMARAAGRADVLTENTAQFEAAAADGNWEDAVRAAQARAKAFADVHVGDANGLSVASDRTDIRPRLAGALAHAGQIAQALAVIAATAPDCYACTRARAAIEALRGKPRAAEYWFAQSVRLAPSIPFAYADWGEMLLHKGDFDAAIAKFIVAYRKGPHFADPLELWGEALMLKNRSDLALPKFEEAAKYAPNWGRLHLEWGKALFYTGRKDESKKRIAMAAGLDLSAADKASLDNWIKTHG